MSASPWELDAIIREFDGATGSGTCQQAARLILQARQAQVRVDVERIREIIEDVDKAVQEMYAKPEVDHGANLAFYCGAMRGALQAVLDEVERGEIAESRSMKAMRLADELRDAGW